MFKLLKCHRGGYLPLLYKPIHTSPRSVLGSSCRTFCSKIKVSYESSVENKMYKDIEITMVFCLWYHAEVDKITLN